MIIKFFRVWIKFNKDRLKNIIFEKINFIIFIPMNYLFAVEVTCNFEEVYQNGEIQEGILMLIKNQNV